MPIPQWPYFGRSKVNAIPRNLRNHSNVAKQPVLPEKLVNKQSSTRKKGKATTTTTTRKN
eukprot:scaffold65103_cov44-Attheya_sp.AAC.1